MAKTGWETSYTYIDTKDRKRFLVPSIAPPIISASRATDIPAFYPGWFLDRLQKGYSVWVNPMNRDNVQVVDLRNVKCIVFWTKNAAPLMERLDEIPDRIQYYFQYTLNDYEDEDLEPWFKNPDDGSPHLTLDDRIATFRELSNRIGKERVVWRFDPLVLSDDINHRIDIGTLIDKIERIGDKIHNYTEKLVISFVDIDRYSAVSKRARQRGMREFAPEDQCDFAAELVSLKEQKEWKLEIVTCGEKIDPPLLGIAENKCIDDALIRRICGDEPAFLRYLDEHSGKDKGQRPACGCIPSKDIGVYHTCGHGCVYCYATHSRGSASTANRGTSRNYPYTATLDGSTGWEDRVIAKFENDQQRLEGERQRLEDERRGLESEDAGWNWQKAARTEPPPKKRAPRSKGARKR